MMTDKFVLDISQLPGGASILNRPRLMQFHCWHPVIFPAFRFIGKLPCTRKISTVSVGLGFCKFFFQLLSLLLVNNHLREASLISHDEIISTVQVVASFETAKTFQCTQHVYSLGTLIR